MIGLFDQYNDMTKNLMQSLDTAGISYIPIFAQYHGELPEDAICPFTYYTETGEEGRELFFDEISVPKYCEIRQGSHVFGEVLQDGYLIGRINYRPNSFRLVQSVDWLLRDQKISRTDHYNQFGKRYGASYYHNGVPYQTVYYHGADEVIQMNLISGFITLIYENKRYGFANLTRFLMHFMDELELSDDRTLINSLSYPLFVSRERSLRPDTVLFWQEKIEDQLPGNMTEELLRQKALTDIVFFNKDYLEKARADYPSAQQKLSYLSHIGQFAEKHYYDKKRVFILTSSDQIHGIEKLLGAFPELTFSVAALTQMSGKLHGLGSEYPNLVLTPNTNQKEIREEIKKASVYLDINGGGHVLDVVKDAYYGNLLVLALAPFAKAPDYSLNYSSDDELMEVLSAAVNRDDERDKLIKELHEKQGPLSTAEDYRKLFI